MIHDFQKQMAFDYLDEHGPWPSEQAAVTALIEKMFIPAAQAKEAASAWFAEARKDWGEEEE